MPRTTLAAHIDTITDTKSLDTTEDTYFVFQNGNLLTLMVADGAPQRLATTHSLSSMLAAYGENTTPGRYAALVARDVCARLAVTAPDMPLRELALAANAHVAAELEAIFGEVTAEAVLALEPSLTVLREDPRYVRWILPVACLTLVRIDLNTGHLTYAHGGDTALFALHADGRTTQVTPDQMGQHDDKVRREIANVIDQTGERDPDQLRQQLTVAGALNRYNGIYHNYVDEEGRPDPALGCGVINGLPELDAYLVTGELNAAELEAVVVCSDGCFWPNPLDETPDQAEQRVYMMGMMLRANGLEGYIRALRREEASDADGAKYLRFGAHDDATALMVSFRQALA